jgi:gluconolactonase
VLLPDGTIAFCDGTNGVILGLCDGLVHEIGCVGGSPNGLTLGADGALYVAQLGTQDPVRRPVPPSIQRLTLDGDVTTVATACDDLPFVAPNDLAFGPDGRLYFTDSGDVDHVNPVGPGRVFAVSDEWVELVLELDPCFANGIGFDSRGRLIWTETATRRICRLEAGRERLLAELPEEHIPDGFAIGADGRLFVATVTSGGITVLSSDGDLVDHLLVGAEPTNCVFAGATLIVTAFSSSGVPDGGQLLAVETETTGIPLLAGRIRPIH